MAKVTTKTTSAPWGPQQGFLQDLWSQAQQQYGAPMEQFGGSRVGGLSAMTLEGQQAGLGLIRGAGGGPEEDYIRRLMGGEFLDPSSNPQLRALADQGAADITRQYKQAVYPGASLAGLGRAGSPAESRLQGQAMRGLGDALSRNYSNIYGQNYARERGYMQQGVGMASQLGAGRRADIGLGAQLGQGADTYEQRLIDDLVNKFNFQQWEPEQRLDRYAGRITGQGVIPGMSKTTQTMPGQPFGAAQGFGLGLGALGLFTSTRTAKEEFSVVDYEEMFEMLKALDVSIWRYKPEVVDQRPDLDRNWHIGPYAEDVQQIFHVGDGKTLLGVDIIGIAISAVKSCAQRILKLEDRLTEYESVLKFEPVEVAHA